MKRLLNVLLLVAATGCVYVPSRYHYDPPPPPPPAPAPVQQVSVWYQGQHFVPDGEGGGWCYEEGSHRHTYYPDRPDDYDFAEGFYWYRGDWSFRYVDGHPLPGGGWCAFHGNHVHDYYPPASRDWVWRAGRGYVYQGTYRRDRPAPVTYWPAPAPRPARRGFAAPRPAPAPVAYPAPRPAPAPATYPAPRPAPAPAPGSYRPAPAPYPAPAPVVERDDRPGRSGHTPAHAGTLPPGHGGTPPGQLDHDRGNPGRGHDDDRSHPGRGHDDDRGHPGRGRDDRPATVPTTPAAYTPAPSPSLPERGRSGDAPGHAGRGDERGPRVSSPAPAAAPPSAAPSAARGRDRDERPATAAPERSDREDRARGPKDDRGADESRRAPGGEKEPGEHGDDNASPRRRR